MVPEHAQRGGSCSIVLTVNMFSSSSAAQRVSNAVFFSASAAHVQEHMFAFNTLYFFYSFDTLKPYRSLI